MKPCCKKCEPIESRYCEQPFCRCHTSEEPQVKCPTEERKEYYCTSGCGCEYPNGSGAHEYECQWKVFDKCQFCDKRHFPVAIGYECPSPEHSDWETREREAWNNLNRQEPVEKMMCDENLNGDHREEIANYWIERINAVRKEDENFREQSYNLGFAACAKFSGKWIKEATISERERCLQIVKSKIIMPDNIDVKRIAEYHANNDVCNNIIEDILSTASAKIKEV